MTAQFLRTAAAIVNYNSLPNPAHVGSAEQTILNIVFGISASTALLMVTINGFRYIIARGDPNATASAKNSILYAIIGLIVIMAAYSIVVFVVRGIG